MGDLLTRLVPPPLQVRPPVQLHSTRLANEPMRRSIGLLFSRFPPLLPPFLCIIVFLYYFLCFFPHNFCTKGYSYTCTTHRKFV